MDPRGPPEGAPGDPLDISLVSDKTSDIADSWSIDHSVSSPLCDQPKKMNNRLLFLAVEYVDEQPKDYSRIFPAYEQVSFSPRTSSPLSDFEHRVSPLDPNMSSTARYSPTPVQLPPSPFQNSVVVLQNPSSPMICPPETNARAGINYVSQLTDQNNVQSIPQSGTGTDFVDRSTDEELVTEVEGELILVQGSTPDLEPSAAPLMLTGIPNTDFALTRDFLVMNDDQINAMGSLRNQSLEIGDGDVITPTQTINVRDAAVSPKKEPSRVFDEILLGSEVENEKECVRRSKRINDRKAFWCDECNSICENANDCTSHNVHTIADQPVPSRAIATLPGSYLSINKLPSSQVLQGGLEYGVFAKRNIRKRTQFGPIEGILYVYDQTPFINVLPLLYETADGKFMKVDVSNEHASNWMRFVRPAISYKEQNLVICQQNDGIVFLTTKDILPKEELRAGPSSDYAIRRNLQILKPDIKEEKEGLRKHPNGHNSSITESKQKKKRKEIHIPSKKFFKIVDGQTLLYTCPHCPKVFPRSYSLKRHLLIHPGAKAPRYECPTCGENFLHPYNRSRHMKIFHGADPKEKENSRQNTMEWKCRTCTLAFGKASLLNLHSLVHKADSLEAGKGQSSVCPQCGTEFKKRIDLINHVSQHGRLQLSKAGKLNTLAAYKCSRCYKRFATKVRLQQHCLVHGAEDQKPLPCEICRKRFMNNSALSCHLKTHRDKQVFECPMCRQLFDQVLMLKDHIETHRNDDETFTCPYCLRSFVKYSVIRKHIRAHHCERKHTCQLCANRFPTVDKLRMHMLRHSDYREFHCANCGKQFKRKDKLKEHMTRMHNSDRANREQVAQTQSAKKFVPKVNPTDYNRFVYKCHRCMVGFKRRGMLVNHLAKRHPDVPPESVPELNLPILRQTRDYYCQYCDKVYKSSSKRKAHIMKNHPGAAVPPSNRQKESDISGLPNPTFSQTVGSITTTPQGCQWCHKQYASKAKLLQHQRKKHPNLMEPADQVPRPRNRPPQNQNQPPALGENFLIAEYVQPCDLEQSFLKTKIIKLSNDVDLVTNGYEMVGQQFVRMRDIR
ncbi:PR domain zinc finger protein 10 isoform X2 [Orussus abietinus]|uniref:PR domain zinc finger protein 10 isoform X2 n=1 Tax=Orussus abietinus TaxID=222816 RepID=UPI0006268CF0|nr:PR domain zinc finger protein 10 isoform X2 [Orussus abietinus]